MRAQRSRLLAAAVLALAAFALAGAGTAQALAPGSLDTTFGGTGFVTLASGSQLFGVAVQPNGEIVAAGHASGRVFVERLTVAGSVDGIYVGGSGIARAVAIQPDGKVVIAGTSGGAMFAERLTSSLSPDASFGSGGIATALPGSGGIATGVALEPDGSVVIGGVVGSFNTRAGAARFASNGSLEWSEVPGFDQYSMISAVAVQPADGKIVFVGQQTPLQATDALIGRLNPNGSLDSSFGGGAGVFTYHYPGGGATSLNAVTVQNDGRIVAAGVDVGGPNAIFARFNTNGTFDSTFGSGGIAALPSAKNLSNNSGAQVGANAVAIAGGGRITASGVLDNAGTVFDAAAWALTPGGTPESSFGAGGTTATPSNQYEACALAIAPDGSLVSAGNKIGGFSDDHPCSINITSAGFVARYVGFGPPPPPQTGTVPVVATGAASSVRETSATVSGTVNPGGLTTHYHFEYGLTTGYGSSTPAATLAAAADTVPVSQSVSGLAPGTTYHYRLVASNADGTTSGRDMMFTTTSRPPSASTGRATGVGEITATLGGTVNTHGLATVYYFDYGTTTRYGSRTALAGTSSSARVAVSARLTRLKPGTTYHYRLVAANPQGTSYGVDRKFRTAPRLKLTVSTPASSYSIKSLQRAAARLGVRCDQPCKIDGAFVISAADAKRLKLGTRSVSVAVGSVTLRRGGRGTLSIGLTKQAKGAVAQLPGLKVTLRIVASPTGGGPRVSYSKTINFSR